jgi:hypothetical protein
MRRAKLLVLVVVAAALTLSAGSAEAQTDMPPMVVPGCSYWPYDYVYTVGGWRQTYTTWCGSEEVGWYKPDEWCAYSGYCVVDYYGPER